MFISFNFSETPKIRKAQKFFLWTVVGLTLVVVMGLVLGYLVQLLWNVTLAEMFGLPTISLWQAIGLFILAKLFFGFGAGASSSSRKPKRQSSDQGPSEESDGVSKLADDETFKNFWQEEGKESYEAFRRDGRKDESEES